MSTIQQRLVAALVVTASLFSVAACSVEPSASPSATTVNTPTPRATLQWSIAPLTGRRYLTDGNLQLIGPVVMGKIDNSMGARPQGGLSKADIVYEEMVEGGITRYLAIFHSQMPYRFGPIRSVRPMDPDIATPYGGILAYSGGQRPFVAAARATGLYNASETSEHTIRTMVRLKSRIAPHNLFVIAEKLQGRHMKLGAPTASSLTFAATAAEASAMSGKSVKQVVAKFPATKATWTYDPTFNVFTRVQDGKKVMDADFGVQVSATNILILRVAIDRSFRDSRYGSVPKTVFEGKGKGQLLTGGKIINILWSKKDQKSHAQFTTESGEPVTVAVGNTWFEMVPTTEGGRVDVTYGEFSSPSASSEPSDAPSPSASKVPGPSN